MKYITKIHYININRNIVKIILIIFGIIFLEKNKKENILEIKKFASTNNLDYKLNEIIPYNKTKKELNSQCQIIDPISNFKKRLNINSTILCQSENSFHICYENKLGGYVVSDGLICMMKNAIMDPSKWKDDGFQYNGPVDKSSRGMPLLSDGFFNMKCDIKGNITKFEFVYSSYVNSWKYSEYQEKNIEELAPGKTIFFISRNQDSPNLFHGGSEFINAFALMKIFNYKPQDIQVIFLESMNFASNDPFFNLYKYVISGGNEPIHVRKLTKKYKISSGIHIPLNWDSPCFTYDNEPACNKPTETYYYLNQYIDKFLYISQFEDFRNLDDEIFYYPKKYNKEKNYRKYVTFQWRRVWPKGRTGQQRVIGNGPELVEKLSEKLPDDILLRLVNTASLPIEEQIAIMKKTDYLIGEHGAGLFLSIFLPIKSIVHEISHIGNMRALVRMSRLSGHLTYSNIITAQVYMIEGNENLFFDPSNFTNCIIDSMKKSGFL